MITAEERQEGGEEEKTWEAEREETNNINGKDRGGEISFENDTFINDRFHINQ